MRTSELNDKLQKSISRGEGEQTPCTCRRATTGLWRSLLPTMPQMTILEMLMRQVNGQIGLMAQLGIRGQASDEITRFLAIRRAPGGDRRQGLWPLQWLHHRKNPRVRAYKISFPLFNLISVRIVVMTVVSGRIYVFLRIRGAALRMWGAARVFRGGIFTEARRPRDCSLHASSPCLLVKWRRQDTPTERNSSGDLYSLPACSRSDHASL